MARPSAHNNLEREQGRADDLARELAAVCVTLAAVTAARDAEAARAGQIVVLEAVLEIERQGLAEVRDKAERWRSAEVTPRGLSARLRRAT